MMDGESSLLFSKGALQALAQMLQERLDTIAWGADTREPFTSDDGAK
jgi:hypothetical protein